MRTLMPLLFVVLGACATQDLAESSHTARFSAFPTDLFEAFEHACSDPAQVFARPSRNTAECREFLNPESTASAILQYDGTTADLPQLVIRFATWPDGTDYLLRTEAYLNVPQKSGAPVRVVFAGARFDRKLDRLYRLSGGVPE